MTEAEWQACVDPEQMLKAWGVMESDRKQRLFACACARRVPWVIRDPWSPGTLEAAEMFADGLIGLRELMAAAPYDADQCPVLAAAREDCLTHQASKIAWCWIGDGGTGRRGTPDFWERANAEKVVQCRLLRCVVGSPYRSTCTDALALTPLVRDLARVAYDERILPSGELDLARLGVLSDALEEAGCSDADLLEHLRSPGPHVRGCWAVDLILGKR